jgi:hypothetical protein
VKNKQENIGDSSNVTNTQIEGHGNTVINNPTTANPVPTRTKQEPFKVFGKQVKTKWISIAGIIALIANIMAIYAGFKSLSSHKIFEADNSSSSMLYYFQIALFLIMAFSLYLYQVFKNSVLIIGKHKIASHQGKLYFEEYEATCPSCGSKLKTVSLKGVSFMRCKLYSEHIFRFNPKLFDQEAYQ